MLIFSIKWRKNGDFLLTCCRYNALPAALWPDITANVYLQMTNMIMAKVRKQQLFGSFN